MRQDTGAALDADTVTAVATPHGRGGIGIIRVSGPSAGQICRTITHAGTPAHREVRPATFHDAAGNPIDAGLVVFFEGPRSFTGEDVLELHGHGGTVVIDMVLEATISAGARQARPGEFSERAFLNGKLDLTQAEAVADLIDGATQAAVRSAMRSLRGEFSERINVLAEDLRELRAYVEAAIDFPEEEVDFLGDGTVLRRLNELQQQLRDVAEAARQGAMLAEGVTVVLAGAPNVGKSSLLNRLAGEERAIVTAIPGTTRDVLSAELDLDGIAVRLIDTAGLHSSSDPVEQEGIRRAEAEIANSDLLLMIVDATESATAELPVVAEARDVGTRIVHVLNKVDLTAEPASEPVDPPDAAGRPDAAGAPDPARALDLAGAGQEAVRISALTGAGIPALRARLTQVLGLKPQDEGVFSARRRHLEALAAAAGELEGATDAFGRNGAGELLAEDLRRTHDLLGEITGRVSADELLGDIFGRFCIGK
jgi:tRNA modification GTPase